MSVLRINIVLFGTGNTGSTSIKQKEIIVI